MDKRTARSSKTESKSSSSSSLLSPSHPSVLRYCNPVQFLAMAIRDASVIFMHEKIHLCKPVQ